MNGPTPHPDEFERVAFSPDETLDMFSSMLERALAGIDTADWRGPLWPRLAELGAFTAPVPEERGGYGGALAAAVACRQLARAGIVSPFAVSSASAAFALARMDAPPPEVARLLKAMEAGEAVATLAVHEDDVLPALIEPRSRLVPALSGGWSLDVCKRMVAFAGQADHVLVPAAAPDGVALVVLDAEKLGGGLAHQMLIDGTPAADIDLSGVPVGPYDVIASGPAASALLATMVDALAAAHCAEATGAMRAMIDATRTYLGERRQFGHPLSANQALRHRVVDMEVMLAKAETMAAAAAAAVDGEAGAQRARMVARARYVVMRAAWKVSQEAVQMHGAIGMADETPLGRHFKRLLALSLWFGDEDEALRAAA